MDLKRQGSLSLLLSLLELKFEDAFFYLARLVPQAPICRLR